MFWHHPQTMKKIPQELQSTHENITWSKITINYPDFPKPFIKFYPQNSYTFTLINFQRPLLMTLDWNAHKPIWDRTCFTLDNAGPHLEELQNKLIFPKTIFSSVAS